MPKLSPNVRRWITIAAKLTVVVVLAWFVRKQFVEGIEEIRKRDIALHFGWLILAGLLYLLGQFPSGLYWRRVLSRLGQNPRLGETLRAYYIGHLGKYVPGKALVVILRAGLIKGERVDLSVAAVSVFVETLTTMAVGATLAAVILAIQFREHLQLLVVSVGLALVALIPTLPPVFRRIVRLLRVGKSNPKIVADLERLDNATLLSGWVGITLGWFVMGAAQWATFRGLGFDQLDFGSHWLLLTAAVALAVVAGFASLIPGGLGVRELVLFRLLVMLPGVDQGMAVLASAVFRLVTLVAELAVSGILYAVRPGGAELSAKVDSATTDDRPSPH